MEMGTKNSGRTADRRPVKSARRHSDDRERLAVHEQRLVDHILSRAKSPSPILLAQDDDVAASLLAFVVRPKKTAGCRRQSQHRKIAARDERAVAAFR